MALNDIYKVRFRYLANGDNKDMNMTYMVTDVGTDVNPAQEIAAEWAQHWLPAIAALTHTSCLFQYVDVQNVYNTADFYRMDVTGEDDNNGTIGGEPLMSFNVLRWSKAPNDRAFGYGKLRIAGLSEAMVNGKTYDEATYSDDVAAITVLINQNRNTTFGTEFHPIILKQIPSYTGTPPVFDHWTYSHCQIAGVTFLGLGHKVHNG